MKTAKEWAEMDDPVDAVNEMFSDDASIGTNKLISWIKQIQLDAWKQGMKDAGDIVIRTRMRFPMSSLEITEAQKEIFIKASAREEI